MTGAETHCVRAVVVRRRPLKIVDSTRVQARVASLLAPVMVNVQLAHGALTASVPTRSILANSVPTPWTVPPDFVPTMSAVIRPATVPANLAETMKPISLMVHVASFWRELTPAQSAQTKGSPAAVKMATATV